MFINSLSSQDYFPLCKPGRSKNVYNIFYYIIHVVLAFTAFFYAEQALQIRYSVLIKLVRYIILHGVKFVQNFLLVGRRVLRILDILENQIPQNALKEDSLTFSKLTPNKSSILKVASSILRRFSVLKIIILIIYLTLILPSHFSTRLL